MNREMPAGGHRPRVNSPGKRSVSCANDARCARVAQPEGFPTDSYAAMIKVAAVMVVRDQADLLAVNIRYQAQLADGALVAAGVLNPDRLRGWLRNTPDGIHRYFFQYKLTLLEVWCRTVAPNTQGMTA